MEANTWTSESKTHILFQNHKAIYKDRKETRNLGFAGQSQAQRQASLIFLFFPFH